MDSYMDYELDDAQDYLADDPDRLPEIVVLTSAQIEHALTLSQRIADPGKQWAVYLNGLALAGFRQWLTSRTVNFSLDESHCVILEAAIADGTSAVCHLQARSFRLCLIATEPNPEGPVLIPQPVVDRSDFAAHFYLPITVYEEQSVIGLQGFIQQDVLLQHLATAAFTRPMGHTYQLSSRWLDPDLDSLLLSLNCLDPQPLARPQASAPSLPQRIHQVLVQPIVNTAHWFQAGLQAQAQPISQTWSWVVIPPQTFAGAMRESPTQFGWRESQVETLLDSLCQSAHQGIPIPASARAAFRCITLGEIELHLYAIVSLLESHSTETEWSLLLILKHQMDQRLPRGLTLEVRDSQRMEIVQHLCASTTTGCLFTEVIGALTEQFLVTIALASGVAVTLPTLQFQPAES